MIEQPRQLNMSDLQNMELHLMDFVHLRDEFKKIRSLFTNDTEIMRLHSFAGNKSSVLSPVHQMNLPYGNLK